MAVVRQSPKKLPQNVTKNRLERQKSPSDNFLINFVLISNFQAAKLCKYTNYQKLCDLLFACFALTWVVTRLGVYPTWILYSTTIEAPQIVEMFPAYYIFNGLLAILLVLHVIWTYFILKIIYKAMYSGKVSTVFPCMIARGLA